jgi:hypothetical protein
MAKKIHLIPPHVLIICIEKGRMRTYVTRPHFLFPTNGDDKMKYLVDIYRTQTICSSFWVGWDFVRGFSHSAFGGMADAAANQKIESPTVDVGDGI